MSVYNITSVIYSATNIQVSGYVLNTTVPSSVFTGNVGYRVSCQVYRNSTIVATYGTITQITRKLPNQQFFTLNIAIPNGTLYYVMWYTIHLYDATGKIADTHDERWRTMAQSVNGGNQYKYIGHLTEPGNDALPFDVTGSAATQTEALAEFTAKLATIPSNCTLVSVSAVAPPSSSDNTAIAAVTRPASGPYQTMKLTVTNIVNGFKSSRVIQIVNAAKSFGLAGGKVDLTNATIQAVASNYRDGNNNSGYTLKDGIYTHR